MALTVEDGTGKSGADSYVSLDEAKAYFNARGLAFPIDAAFEKLLVKAMDYLEQEASGPYKGSPTFPGMDTVKWPRTGVVVDEYEIPSSSIPRQLKFAQCQLAFEMQTVDPTPTLSGNIVKREKVDVLETEYAIDYKAGQKPPEVIKVTLLLRPLLRNTPFGLRVSRG